MEVKTEEALEEIKDDGAAEAIEEPDPWDEEVEVFVPRHRQGEDENYYVCVNDRRFSVPRDGKTHKMPRPIGEALQNGIQAEYRAQEYFDSIKVNEPMIGSIV